MEITMKIDISKFEDSIKKKLQKIEMMQPIVDKISADMVKETQLNFMKEQSPDEKKWEDLSFYTLRMRRGEGKGIKKLQDTGQLLQSITGKAKATKNSAYALVGTNKEYARTQQFGATFENKEISKYYKIYKNGAMKLTNKKKANYVETSIMKKMVIPARQFIGFSDKMKKRYLKWIEEYLNS